MDSNDQPPINDKPITDPDGKAPDRSANPETDLRQSDPNVQQRQHDPDAPLATLAEAEDRIDAPKLMSEAEGELLKAKLAAQDDGHQVEERDPEADAFNRAKAMLEGPGGDIGTEIDLGGVRHIESLPMLGVAVDSHGRLWAVDHHEGKLRLVGRVSK